MKILAGPSSIALGKKLSSKLELEFLELDYKHFYDSETYLRIKGEVKDEEILLVQSTYPPQEKHLLELLLLGATLKDLGASRVIAIVPYLCYARADHRKLEGEVLSHQITMELISNSGIDSIITLNVHNPEAFHDSFDDLTKINLNLFSYIGEDLQSNYEEHIIVGPDKGAEEDVKTLAKSLDASYYLLEKKRDARTHEITMTADQLEIANKDVLLIDDIITSGGTAKRASEILLAKDPRSLSFLCIHAISKEEVYQDMKDMGVSEIISTNTIPSKQIKQLDITQYLTQYIKDKFQ